MKKKAFLMFGVFCVGMSNLTAKPSNFGSKTLKMDVILMQNDTTPEKKKRKIVRADVQVVEQNENGKTSRLEVENGKIVSFSVNGETIAPKQYKKYQSQIDAMKNRLPPMPPMPPRTEEYEEGVLPPRTSPEPLAKFLLSQKAIKNPKKYKIKLTTTELFIDGEKQTDELHKATKEHMKCEECVIEIEIENN